jgi:hypothetical protein
MRLVVCGISLAVSLAQLGAATLSRLSLDDMISQSTAIARVRISGSFSAWRGPVIYTYYRVQVVERWKGAGDGSIDVALPGGTVNNSRQDYPGTPQLTEGKEYLLFLWTSRSGLTQIIGLTQGLFDLSQDSTGVLSAIRAASTNSMLDPHTGRSVKDQPIRMQLKDLTTHITTLLAKGRTN